MLTARGCWWVKTTGVSKVGCPDLLICYKGAFIALEVKRHRDSSYKLTTKQKYELNKIRKAQGLAYVAYSVEDAESVLAEVDHEQSSRDAER